MSCRAAQLEVFARKPQCVARSTRAMKRVLRFLIPGFVLVKKVFHIDLAVRDICCDSYNCDVEGVLDRHSEAFQVQPLMLAPLKVFLSPIAGNERCLRACVPLGPLAMQLFSLLALKLGFVQELAGGKDSKAWLLRSIDDPLHS